MTCCKVSYYVVDNPSHPSKEDVFGFQFNLDDWRVVDVDTDQHLLYIVIESLDNGLYFLYVKDMETGILFDGKQIERTDKTFTFNHTWKHV